VIPERLRPWVTRGVDRVARRLHREQPHPLWLESPPSAAPGPRHGYGRPRHARLEGILASHAERYRVELEAMTEFADDLGRIGKHASGAADPCWLNPWLPPLDIVSLYSFLRRRKPARYVEVGSGNSTAVAALARRDADLSTEITSIDPRPRREIDALCDRVIRRPLEVADLSVFDDLEPGDVVFVDGSHRVYTNSDATVMVLDVLPALPDGVLVGIHDILWPDDYLPEWSQYWWSEQYLVGALLLGEPAWLTPVLACHYASGRPDLMRALDPLWTAPRLQGVERWGCALWLAIERERKEAV
jgi:predicted O-methyltransferase YrrM